DITGRSINGRACGQHLAIADGFEIAVKLLVNCHSAQGRIRRFVVLRGQLYFKRSASISRHNILLLSFLLNWSLNGGLPYGDNLLLQMIKRVGGWRCENPVGLALAVPYDDAAKRC